MEKILWLSTSINIIELLYDMRHISPNKKVYVGQSIKIEKRFIDHKRRAKNKSSKSQSKLYNSIRKYGWDSFEKRIIEECSISELDNREIFYISLFKSIKKGLNGKEGGKSGWKITRSIKNKLRKMNLGKYNGNQNIEFTIDGILFSSIGEASKKLNIPPKTIHNRLNSKNIKYSEYRYTDLTKIPIRKRVISKRERKILIDGIEYQSIAEAQRSTGISKSTIFYRKRIGIY